MKFQPSLVAGLGLIGGAGLLALAPGVALAATPGMTTPAAPGQSPPAQSAPEQYAPAQAAPAPTAAPARQTAGLMRSEFPVLQLQEALDAHGANLREDGIFGPNTDAALKRYQRAHGIMASGELDRATRASLGLLG